MQWSADGAHLAFVSTSRDHKQEWFRVADASTGDVREVMSETAPKFFESGNDKVNWHYLPDSNEILWFSERDNWGQLYLYDLTTGKLKNQITHGDGNVTQVLCVDEKTRTIYFLGVGKEPGRDPYFSALLQRPLRRHGPEAADAGKRRPRHHALARRPLLRRRLLHAHRAADHRGPRQRRQARRWKSPNRTSPNSSPRLGSAHADHSERRATARPISMA